jgi:hypothetical protein
MQDDLIVIKISYDTLWKVIRVIEWCKLTGRMV